MKEVDKDMKSWNPDTQSVSITTNSLPGNPEMMWVDFFDKLNVKVSDIRITFSETIDYYIDGCTTWTTLSTPHTGALQTWTIIYNTAQQNVSVYSNGKEEVNMHCQWIKPTQIQFSGIDSASDTYCYSTLSTGNCNGGH